LSAATSPSRLLIWRKSAVRGRVAGVRPEHLVRGSDGPFVAEGVVELVERLGESSFAHVRRADDRLFVAEVRGRETPAPGERVTLIAASQDVHVFDASGLRVSTLDNS
jgi:ABC-type sugar transport system ATPase subunit